ncbi:MAG: hypothetical protein HUU31_06155, partial [Anaerolineae bacterium]|nr:hypothetical protein [Anaerolineae bacterium]
SGAGLQLSYFRFETDDADRLDLDPGAGNNVIRSLVTHPATLNQAFDSLSASAAHSIQVDQVDLTGWMSFGDGCAVSIHGLGGLRFGRLEQEFRSEFQILGRTTVDTNIDFEGVGPQLGVLSVVEVGGGLMAYGQGLASFLVGKSSGDYRQENEFQGVLAETGFDKTRIVPVLELEMGLGWQNEWLRATLGYTIISWRNLVTTNGFIQSVQ